MIVELSNGKTQNAYFIGDIQAIKNEVWIFLTNGTKYLEGKYDSPETAKSRREELITVIK